jgi:molecular chaperone GrpE
LLKEAIGKYRQAASEFEESRLRLRREISKEIERGRRELLADLLEVVDNLDRALDAARHSASPQALLEGVEMVRRQFLAKLEGLGVRRIESEGQPFDPLLHDAISTVPAATPDHDGLIVGVVRQGYTIGDEVLRPASVAVAKETSNSER